MVFYCNLGLRSCSLVSSPKQTRPPRVSRDSYLGTLPCKMRLRIKKKATTGRIAKAAVYSLAPFVPFIPRIKIGIFEGTLETGRDSLTKVTALAWLISPLEASLPRSLIHFPSQCLSDFQLYSGQPEFSASDQWVHQTVRESHYLELVSIHKDHFPKLGHQTSTGKACIFFSPSCQSVPWEMF